PSKWGNCCTVSGDAPSFTVSINGFAAWEGVFETREAARAHAVRAYRWQLLNHPDVVGVTAADVRAELSGRVLACWCPLDQPCHADVLIEIANERGEEASECVQDDW